MYLYVLGKLFICKDLFISLFNILAIDHRHFDLAIGVYSGPSHHHLLTGLLQSPSCILLCLFQIIIGVAASVIF